MEIISLFLVIILMETIVFLSLQVQKRLSVRFNVRKETALIFCCCLLIVIIGVFELNFFKTERVIPQKFIEEEPDSIVIAEVIESNISCGNKFCFSAMINSSIKGTFSAGEKITVETDCQMLPWGLVEIRGKEKQDGIISKCSQLSMLSPMGVN